MLASHDNAPGAGRKCPGCGQPLPADAPRGVCPSCLLGLLEEDADRAPDEAEDPGADSQATGAKRPASFLAPADRRFGDYELIEEIARGGMGVVYKARQRSLDRFVAVKVILPGCFASRQFVQRFRAEAAAAAILQHPNIVAVHEVGIHAGQHFFSMDYIEGRNLAELVGNRPLAPAQAARYVRLIADAIQYAHDQGILHRDLKPSNVVVDSATDQPRVTDFGLARRLVDSQRSTLNSPLTLTGQVLGSPNFMPPEQAGKTHGRIGRHSDVYALGGILYFLLTARAPFHGESLETIVMQVLNRAPVPPRLLNPAVPRDLETICLKCLEKEPGRRYPTARALVEELDRFLHHEPVHARPLGLVGKLWRWCRHRPALATTVILLHAVFALGLTGILWQWRRAEQERAVAQENLYAADMLLTQQALEGSNFGRARELLDRWRPPTRPSPLTTDHWTLMTDHRPLITDHWPLPTRRASDLRGWEWHYLWRLCRSDELTTLGTHRSPVTALSFSPDGVRLATASLNGEVRLWDLPNRRLIAAGQHPPQVQTLAFSSDGRWLASGGHTSGIRLWEGRTLTSRGVFGSLADQVMTVHFAARDGQLLACGLEQLASYDLASRGPATRSPMDGGWNNAFSADGRWLAAGRLRGPVVLRSLTDPIQSHTLTGHTAGVYGVAFSPDSRWLASASADDTARVWEAETRREVAVLRGHRITVNAVAFSPSSSLLATASGDQTVKLWDTDTWQERATLRGHSSRVQCVGFSPDGLALASGDFEGVIKLWSTIRPPEETNRLVFPSNARLRMIAPDLSRLGAINEDGRLLEWDLSGPAPLCLESTIVLPQRNIATAPGGRLRATDAGRGVLQLWDEFWHEVAAFRGTNVAIRSMQFSPDSGGAGEFLASSRLTRRFQPVY